MPLDFIEFFQKRSSAFPEKIIKLYKEGYSQREIVQELALTEHAVSKVIKEFRSSPSNQNEFSMSWWRQRIKKARLNPSYGYYAFQGSLVKDPKEYPIVQLIANLWKQGKRISDIKAELTSRKIKPRRGKNWDRTTIKKIIMKELESKIDSKAIQFKRKKGG